MTMVEMTMEGEKINLLRQQSGLLPLLNEHRVIHLILTVKGDNAQKSKKVNEESFEE
jgi:hypothetical protein